MLHFTNGTLRKRIEDNNMEIVWLCKNCDTKNLYNIINLCDAKSFFKEIGACNMCGENIDMESAAECSYEFAEKFYGKAVAS